MRRPIALLIASVLLVACGGDDAKTNPSATDSSVTVSSDAPTTVESIVAETTTSPTTEAPIATLPAEQVAALVAERPYNIFVPSTYDATTPTPLVMMLHGFRTNSTTIEEYFQFQAIAEARGFIYIRPEGSLNEVGEQFWNATDACCGGSSTVDDSTYLSAVIDDVKAKLNVDPKQVFIVGYSNGGFMAHRMACDHADVFAAVVSVSGAMFLDATQCAPSQAVSVLEVHGTADTVIFYDGGTFIEPNAYPSAIETASSWSTYDQCTTGGQPVPFDLDPLFAGDEATIIAFESCADDTTVELWTVSGAGHGPVPATSSSLLIDFLFAHSRA